ncbi:cytoplasmic trehalase [Alsobacter metallidurans]|uniref:Cytoplasmic trehalase n=1 Tax=Alsobacter metallidurans TaxID=340221 RepID=A0A917MIX0_9HYPH|nr:alpha,alpha-trehalase TreF [Alsobacter metallidurans]GGH28284.1 cytoplasmic trehalase [Alsobacter metallidurans]
MAFEALSVRRSQASLRFPGEEALPPSRLFRALFEAVQSARLFPDSKTFADCTPRVDPAAILAAWEAERGDAGFDLAGFVAAHFMLPPASETGFMTVAGRDVPAHIDALWPLLERHAEAPAPGSSLLALAKPYVVPGGRFGEIYYWDSYFTMLGLVRSGREDLAAAMVENFAHLIETYGHVPNGNRSYYLTRSQPPFFALMVALIAGLRDHAETYRAYLPALEAEYAFWMAGAEDLAPGHAHRRAVRLADGAILNRYWDDRATPRDESWREDMETAEAAPGREPTQVWRDLRAAAESGWDFSSRWLKPGGGLETIRTTSIAPIDLNCLLLQLETTLGEAYGWAGETQAADAVKDAARRRRDAIHAHFWDPRQGAFGDLLWEEGRHTGVLSAATLFPLFLGFTTGGRARAVAAAVRRELLAPGGLVTTRVRSGEQWDEPNGWAPLQWIAVAGLTQYDEYALANEIARRWIAKVGHVYAATGKLMEKYDVVSEDLAAGGGEYPNQDGFGWTNGVTRELMARYPELGVVPLPAANLARTGG